MNWSGRADFNSGAQFADFIFHATGGHATDCYMRRAYQIEGLGHPAREAAVVRTTQYKRVDRDQSGTGYGAVRVRGGVGNSARPVAESSRRISRYRKQSTR